MSQVAASGLARCHCRLSFAAGQATGPEAGVKDPASGSLLTFGVCGKVSHRRMREGIAENVLFGIEGLTFVSA